MRASDWLDTAEYPFANHFFETSAGKLHYVDEGTGKPIIFLHGNPDWSFSYRQVIKALSKHYRCLAPDYLGFGLSDKPKNYDYKPWQLARQIEAWVHHLQLSDITLVMNDWGGPIGLDFALRNPERVQNLVIMNTWCWPLNGYPTFWLFSHFMRGKSGQMLTGQLNVFSSLLVWLAIHRKSAFTGAIHRQYKGPYPSADERQAQIALPYYLLKGKDWFQHLWDNVQFLREKEAVMIWGLKDPAFSRHFLEEWQNILPDAEVLKLANAGHFPQECEPEQVSGAIRTLLSNQSL